MAEEAMDEAKRKRRTAKAALTRRGNTLRKKLKEDRPIDEIMEAFHGMKTAFENLVIKHEEYTQLIEDDGAFEEEEKIMVGGVQGFLSPDGNRCKGLPENKIGIE